MGGNVDYIVDLAEIKEELRAGTGGGEIAAADLEKKARDVALNRGRDSAKNKVINEKGLHCMPTSSYGNSTGVAAREVMDLAPRVYPVLV